MATLLRITAPYFTAGLEFNPRTKKVTNAAPILKWAVGKPVDHVTYWCKKKGFQYEEIKFADLRFIKNKGGAT